MPKKKPKGRMYFDQDVQDAVVEYNSNPDNIQFLQNFMGYFHSRLIEIDGSISVDIPDFMPPSIFIKSPRDNSIVKGTVIIEADVIDAFGVESIEIYVTKNITVFVERVP